MLIEIWSDLVCPWCYIGFARIERLRQELKAVAPQMCGDCQRRAETNPLRVLDCKVPEDQPIIDHLPTILQYLCEVCKPHFAAVQQYLTDRNIPFAVKPRLVRGLDYYMRTTFEITAPGLGSQNAVCGGGRYDGLVELLGGPAATKGIGFAIGTDPYPDRSATLVIEVPVLGAGAARRWRGPGIDGQAAVAVGGLGADFWQAWADNHALFPCGVDVVFAAGSQLLALPRSIAVEG